MKNINEYITEKLLDNKLLKPLRDFIQRNFKKKVGFKEMITVCIQGDKYEFSATIDTGNGGVVPTLGVDKMNIEGDKVTIFIGDKEYTFDKKGEASPTVGNVVHHRPIIIIDYIKIGGRRLDEPFIAVTDERKKSTKSLINRDTMSKLNLVVDPSKNNLIHEKLKVNKDIYDSTDAFVDDAIEQIRNYFNKEDFSIHPEDITYERSINKLSYKEFIVLKFKNYPSWLYGNEEINKFCKFLNTAKSNINKETLTDTLYEDVHVCDGKWIAIQLSCFKNK